MKPTELMINDWVDIQEDSKHLKYTKVRVLAEGHEEWYYFPIPLTEEILEANGFSIGHVGLELSKRLGTDIKYSLTTSADTVITFIGEFCEIRSKNVLLPMLPLRHVGYVRFVHELQHALRLCGLRELADNFKIE